jgi:hypothetical protein
LALRRRFAGLLLAVGLSRVGKPFRIRLGSVAYAALATLSRIASA